MFLVDVKDSELCPNVDTPVLDDGSPVQDAPSGETSLPVKFICSYCLLLFNRTADSETHCQPRLLEILLSAIFEIIKEFSSLIHV